MSLKGGNYRGFVNEIETKFAQIEVAADALESDLSGSIADFKVEFQDLSAEVQDLSAQVNAGGSGVGEVITTFPLGRKFEELNVEYVVEAVIGSAWSVTLTAGTYMFVFTPNAYLISVDNDHPPWSSTNCNCDYLQYNLGNYELRMSIYPDLSVPPFANNGPHKKYLGKQTLIFTLATETTLGLTAKMSSPEIGIVVLDPTIWGYSTSTIEYVKLA